jgi:tetratricopeptide (TPR) repeat protein
VLNQFGVRFVEVRPNLEFTLKTASAALSENPIFGYGPNTFVYAWFNHRPSEILSTPFWQSRFNSGFGFIPTLLVTIGLFGVLFLLAFIALFLYYGFRALVKSYSSQAFLILASFAGAVYLWAFAFVYPGNLSLLFLLFLLSGIFLSFAVRRGVIDYYEISFFEHSVSGFMGALSLILFIVLGAAWTSLLAQKYYAAILYGQGVEAAARGEIEDAGNYFSRAIRFDRRDLYLRSSAELGIARLQQVVASSGSVPQQELQRRFKDVFAQTVQDAQDASAINPADAANWMNLGRIYEAVIPLQIREAADFAKASYEKAKEAFPSSPEPLLAAARIEVARNDLPRAKEFLKESISLKKDFAQAHFLLAQIEAATGNIGGAIQSAETAVFLAPNDVGAFFQLGLLYYQEKRYSEAKSVFEHAVGINSSYSNARYFLGLIYSREGDMNKALAEFRRIEELNPNNAEVKKIIENLIQGRDPLFEISPPGPQPGNRGRAPVDD